MVRSPGVPCVINFICAICFEMSSSSYSCPFVSCSMAQCQQPIVQIRVVHTLGESGSSHSFAKRSLVTLAKSDGDRGRALRLNKNAMTPNWTNGLAGLLKAGPVYRRRIRKTILREHAIEVEPLMRSRIGYQVRRCY